jgi:hypothetical protein
LPEPLTTPDSRAVASALSALPQRRLNSGIFVARDWIAAAGALQHHEMRVINHVASDRFLVGCAIGLAPRR